MDDNFRSLLEQSRYLTNEQQLSVAPMPVETSSIKIERPLDQLEAQSRKLWQKIARTRGAATTDGVPESILGREFDARRIGRALDSMEATPSHFVEMGAAPEDIDVDGLVRNEHETAVVKVIDFMHDQSMAEHDAAWDSAMLRNWDETKKEIFSSLANYGALSHTNKRYPSTAVDSASRDGHFGQHNLRTPVGPPPTPGARISTASEGGRIGAYAQAIQQFNDSRLLQQPKSLIRLLREASKKSLNMLESQMTDTWDLVAFIAGDSESGNGERRSPSRLTRLYPDLSEEQHATVSSQKILSGGIKWLESQFQRFLDIQANTLFSQPESANGVSNDSRQFEQAQQMRRMVKVPFLRKIHLWMKEVLLRQNPGVAWEMVDGIPFWMTVFYLIRAGCDHEALDFVRSYERYLAKTDKRFLEFISAWALSRQRRLPAKLNQELAQEFNTKIRDGFSHAQPLLGSLAGQRGGYGQGPHGGSTAAVDPYKYLVYRIIGKLGVEDTRIPEPILRGLASGSLGWEDDVWIQLMLASESPSSQDDSGVTYTLKDVYDRHVSPIGSNAWSANGTQPVRYLQVLLLCGRVDLALQYLWNCATDTETPSSGQLQWSPEIETVHLAIAMVYCGLVRGAEQEHSSAVDTVLDPAACPDLLFTANNCIKWEHLVYWYAQFVCIRAADAYVAAQYFFMLSGGSSATRWLVDLILDVGMIDEFFGALDPNSINGGNIRTAGYLDKYLPLLNMNTWQDFKTRLILPAAQKAERQAVASVKKTGLQVADLRDLGDIQENNAILLYNLAEEYDVVLDMMSRKVSDCLGSQGFESAVDMVVAVAERGHSTMTGQHVPIDVTHLTQVGETAKSLLSYYASHPHIRLRVSNDRRKTLSTLLHVVSFYTFVCSSVRSFVDGGSQVFGAGQDCRAGLAILVETGIFPQELTSPVAGGKSLFGQSGRLSAASMRDTSSSFMASPSSRMSATTEVEYTHFTSRSNYIRREFTDILLCHLPEVFLAAELLIFMEWFQLRSESAAGQGESMASLARLSRDVLSFTSIVGRWYKISPDIRRRQLAMDEKIT